MVTLLASFAERKARKGVDLAGRVTKEGRRRGRGHWKEHHEGRKWYWISKVGHLLKEELWMIKSGGRRIEWQLLGQRRKWRVGLFDLIRGPIFIFCCVIDLTLVTLLLVITQQTTTLENLYLFLFYCSWINKFKSISCLILIFSI